MKQFKDFDDFKAQAEFFPRGRIVPRRIGKVLSRGREAKQFSHRLTFGGNVWVGRAYGYFLIVAEPGSECAIKLQAKHLPEPQGLSFKNVMIFGHQGGVSFEAVNSWIEERQKEPK